MQMYEVSFQSHYENIIDIGRVIVCASDSEEASKVVCVSLNLPRSVTTFTTVRIKPSLFQLERREVNKPREKSKIQYGAKPVKLTEKYRCAASATITAATEDHALRQFGKAIVDRGSADRAIVDKRVQGMVVDIKQVAGQRHLKPMEEVELYKARI